MTPTPPTATHIHSPDPQHPWPSRSSTPRQQCPARGSTRRRAYQPGALARRARHTSDEAATAVGTQAITLTCRALVRLAPAIPHAAVSRCLRTTRPPRTGHPTRDTRTQSEQGRGNSGSCVSWHTRHCRARAQYTVRKTTISRHTKPRRSEGGNACPSTQGTSAFSPRPRPSCLAPRLCLRYFDKIPCLSRASRNYYGHYDVVTTSEFVPSPTQDDTTCHGRGHAEVRGSLF